MLHIGLDTNITNVAYLAYMDSQENKNRRKNSGHRYVNDRDEIIYTASKEMNLLAKTFGYIFSDDDYNDKLENILSRFSLSINDLTNSETKKIIKAVHDGLEGRTYF